MWWEEEEEEEEEARGEEAPAAGAVLLLKVVDREARAARAASMAGGIRTLVLLLLSEPGLPGPLASASEALERRLLPVALAVPVRVASTAAEKMALALWAKWGAE